MTACPFCGSKRAPWLYAKENASYAVVCNRCGARGPLADSEELADAAFASTTSKPRDATDEEIREWANRHDLNVWDHLGEARAAFEDAQTLHMTDGVGVALAATQRSIGPDTRLNGIEEQLRARGVVDFKITLVPGASKRPVEEVKRAVADFLEAWLSGNATPLTDFGDSPVLGIAAHGDEWERVARDVAANQRPGEEIKADIAAARERIAGATPTDGATHD